jgi:hypothetical protein
MPLVKFEPKPGVVKTDTPLANEGGYSDGNRVRFWQGRAEPIGGWALNTVSTFQGIARGIHSWTTLEGKPVFSFGTNSHLYGSIGGNLRDITPPLFETTLEDIFTTVSGSAVVTVALPFHNLKAGDAVSFSNHQSTIGGLTIEGDYTVTDVLTRDTFTITHGSNASSTVSSPGGGFVDTLIALPVGLADTDVTGYGTGPYGAGPYSTSPDAQEARVWSVSNWGERGLYNPSGYGLFEWQPETNYIDLAFNGDFATGTGWGLGTGWAIGSGVATKTAGTASNLSQDVRGVLEGGRVYRVTFDLTRTAGSLKFRVNAGTVATVIDVGPASSAITKAGSYSRTFVCPADPLDIIFEADSAFAGTIDNVTYALEDKAYRLLSAPPIIAASFVNPNGVAVALGTTQVGDGAFNPALFRNSDVGNNRDWIPDTNSLASEYVLRGGGGRLMQGLATRQQDLVGSDNGVFSAQFTGDPGNAFSIRLLGTGCGLISRCAMAEQNGFVMWISNTQQFFIFRGVAGSASLGTPEIIPCPVREDVFENIDQNQLAKVHVGINPAFGEMWTFYPDVRDGNECSRAVAFSWTEGHWSTHVLNRTAWCPAGIFPTPIACRDDGRIFNQETGRTANGSALGWFIRTSDFDIGDGDTLLALIGIVPDLARPVGSISFSIHTKEWPNKPPINFGPYTYNTASDTTVRMRAMGRQVAITIAEASTGAFGRFGAMKLDIPQTGAKRGGSN